MNTALFGTRTAIEWECVPGIPKVAFVGRLDGRPVGIIEWSERRYHATTSAGKPLGTFDRAEEAQAALTSAHQNSTEPD